MPKKKPHLLWRYLASVLVHQPGKFYKISMKISKNFMILPLARSDILWIEVTFLKMGKPYLSWRRCITVGRTQDHLHSKMIDASSCLSTSMI